MIIPIQPSELPDKDLFTPMDFIVYRFNYFISQRYDESNHILIWQYEMGYEYLTYSQLKLLYENTNRVISLFDRYGWTMTYTTKSKDDYCPQPFFILKAKL